MRGADPEVQLVWRQHPDYPNWRTFEIGNFEAGDGVRFGVEHLPTCYRRGPLKLIIEIAMGPQHHAWGCFDHDDQPMRYYHTEKALALEVAALAFVLLRDRLNAPGETPSWAP